VPDVGTGWVAAVGFRSRAEFLLGLLWR
jgi:hypothetical protein